MLSRRIRDLLLVERKSIISGMNDEEKTRLKKLFRHRQECLERYNRWEALHREKLTPSEAIRKVGELYEMLPEEAKKKDINIKVEGIRKMHEALSVLGRNK